MPEAVGNHGESGVLPGQEGRASLAPSTVTEQ